MHLRTAFAFAVFMVMKSGVKNIFIPRDINGRGLALLDGECVDALVVLVFFVS